jgi:hypothetical protein
MKSSSAMRTFSMAAPYTARAVPNLSPAPSSVAPALEARERAWGRVLGAAGVWAVCDGMGMGRLVFCDRYQRVNIAGEGVAFMSVAASFAASNRLTLRFLFAKVLQALAAW